MNIKSCILFLSILMLAFAVKAQVLIHGQITYPEFSDEHVIIEKYINGTRSPDIIANYKGKYIIELPFHCVTELVFKADKCFPLKLSVDTRPQDEDQLTNRSYDVPFNIELFPHFKEVKYSSKMLDIFGIIGMSGEGDETFGFVPNQSVLKLIKEYKIIAAQKLAEGTEPTFLSDEPPKPSDAVLITVNEVKAEKSLEKQTANQVQVAKQAAVSEVVAKAKAEELQSARDKLSKENSQSEQKEFTQQDHQNLNKQSKAEAYFEQKRIQEACTNMRRERQRDAELLAASAGLIEKKDSLPSKVNIVKNTIEQSTFFTENYLMYERNGKTLTLVHTTYNWLLFTADYYYFNGKEITKNEYELEKKSVL
jgi:hypothetical protein